ncbi:hypothetical protein HHK36_028436 [Tetracentron sinense]|uniref:Uncharacterized protein n=1 Tax=Tetracentron sinense TaxID=13715 RepID=A0A834YD19_TETSI|nr:hypothetical protein HHK36_028436 [Tetracentron sinense]
MGCLQDEREVLPSNVEVTGAATVVAAAAAAAHGIEVAIEFKPVEHPTEPLNNDQPVNCPLPEPSILNDGRIWKERMSATTVQRRADLPVMKEGGPLESEAAGAKPRRARSSNRMILPSQSAPEHNIIKLLEECNASGD